MKLTKIFAGMAAAAIATTAMAVTASLLIQQLTTICSSLQISHVSTTITMRLL